jgi:hypothetical protein
MRGIVQRRNSAMTRNADLRGIMFAELGDG